MPMAANGLAKLIEECGELQQVAGKRLAYYRTDEHPDGGPPISTRLEDEIADVMAACRLVAELGGLSLSRIHRRFDHKLRRFRAWHEDTDNNVDGIDAPSPELRARIESLEDRCSMACIEPNPECACAGCTFAREHHARVREGS